MKTLFAIIAAAALLSSATAMAEDTFNSAIEDALVLFEVMDDVSSRCKIEVQVRGKAGLNEESCRKMHSLHEEYMDTVKVLHSFRGHESVEDVPKSNMAKMIGHASNALSNLKYINLSAK